MTDSMPPPSNTEFFRALAERSRDVIYYHQVEPESRFVYVNRAVTAVTGYAPQDFYEDPELYLKILLADDAPLLQAYRDKPELLAKPLQLRWKHRNGTITLTEFVITPFSSKGRVVATQGVGRALSGPESRDATDVHAALVRARARLVGEADTITVCTCCRSLRQADGRWIRIADLVSSAFAAWPRHTICDRCAKGIYGEPDEG